MKPSISVITVTLNAEKYLEQTIQSVLNQTYPRIEYIIVDGGSTDHTLSIISHYKNRIACVVSEKDGGIAEAMNKGVALATGDYVVFLHADDYFKNDNSLENALDVLESDTDVIACNIQFGKQFKICKPRGFNFSLNFKGIPHQGTLCRKSLITALNGFDQQFDICMDYDLFLRAYHGRARLVKSPVVLAVMRDTGISSRQDWNNLKKRFDEERRVHQKNCSSLSSNLLYKVYWFLYLPYRYVSSVIRGKAGSSILTRRARCQPVQSSRTMVDKDSER